MLSALAIVFVATAATATETGSRRRALAAGGTRTQRITSFLPFVNVDGEAFYGQRQLAIVAAMAIRDFNARDGHLVPRFAALDEPCDVELEIQYFNTFFRPERALRVFVEEYFDDQAPDDVIVGASFSSVSGPLASLLTLRAREPSWAF